MMSLFLRMNAFATPETILISLCLLFIFVFLVHQRTNRKGNQEDGLVDSFPPSRRHVLAHFPDPRKQCGAPDLSAEIQALSTGRTVGPNTSNICTSTGFRTDKIKFLGHFPDYSLLSGVRHPEECSPSFDISRALFRPFHPFRWRYHQTIALMKFDPDYWVELEQNYFSTMATRQELLKKHKERIFFHRPGSGPACRELMEMVVQFVCRRYPQYFQLEQVNTILANLLLNTRTNLTATHPLMVIFENIHEEHALMLRNKTDGKYRLRAGAACSSVGWDIVQHRDSPLRAIPAEVPDYASKMALSMDRFFAKMATDQPTQWCSWSIEDWDPPFSSPVVEKGKDKEWKRNRFADSPGDVKMADLKLQCDRQTLRRLPLSGAIAFNFKAVFTPFTELRDDPFVPAFLATVLKSGKEELVSYKSLEHTRRVAVEALERWAREQLERGIVPDNWEARTLDEKPVLSGMAGKVVCQAGLLRGEGHWDGAREKGMG